jgi:hypothetical protein
VEEIIMMLAIALASLSESLPKHFSSVGCNKPNRALALICDGPTTQAVAGVGFKKVPLTTLFDSSEAKTNSCDCEGNVISINAVV